MHHVVRVESSYNPYAIGVVGGRLIRQPRSLPEALATVRMLEARGFNFSLGLAQVNRYNLGKYGLGSYETAFQVCPNLQAGSRILAECYGRFRGDWGKSFSCYYSGNPVTGFRHGYVQKLMASMREAGGRSEGRAATSAIPVVGKPSRRLVTVTRHPLRAGQSDIRRMEPPPQDMVPTLAGQRAPSASHESLPAFGATPSTRPTTVETDPQAPAVDVAFVF